MRDGIDKMPLFFKKFIFCSALFFVGTVYADIPQDLRRGLHLRTVVSNAERAGKFPDEIVRLLIENKVDPAEATAATVSTFPTYIHATSITRAAIGAAPFSAPQIVGAAIRVASQHKDDIRKVAVKTAPAQSAEITVEADKASPKFQNLTDLHKSAKKENKKTPKQLSENAKEGLAGIVLATRGKVTATNAIGQKRDLIRRSKFYSQDVIKTERLSSAQLRFEDNAILGLREKSELNISKYHYGGKRDQGNETIMRLVSGGFRTISGSIGKANKSAYRVHTPAASIGIRGTDYDVVIALDGMVIAAVWSGGITLANDFGALDIGSNSSYLFASIGNGEVPKGMEGMPKEFAVKNGTATALSVEQKKILKEVLADTEISEEIQKFLDNEEDDDEGDEEESENGNDGEDDTENGVEDEEEECPGCLTFDPASPS